MSLPVILIVVFTIVGIASAVITKKSDGPVEEVAETVIEEETEELLGLKEDSLKGKIDLTPKSKE